MRILLYHDLLYGLRVTASPKRPLRLTAPLTHIIPDTQEFSIPNPTCTRVQTVRQGRFPETSARAQGRGFLRGSLRPESWSRTLPKPQGFDTPWKPPKSATTNHASQPACL